MAAQELAAGQMARRRFDDRRFGAARVGDKRRLANARIQARKSLEDGSDRLREENKIGCGAGFLQRASAIDRAQFDRPFQGPLRTDAEYASSESSRTQRQREGAAD